MTLDERLSLLWKTLQKLTPEEIDKELDGAGAPLKGRTALFSTFHSRMEGGEKNAKI